MKKILLLTAVSFMLFACSKEEQSVDATNLSQETPGLSDDVTVVPLVANFDFVSDTVSESDDLGIVNLSTGATSYEWDFGLDNQFTDEVPDFRFLSHGIYDVKLTVWNNQGESHTTFKTINVLCVFGGGTGGTEHSTD